MRSDPLSVTAGPDDGLARELAFHERCYAEDGRASVAKYYEVSRARRARYQALLAERSAGGQVLEYGCGSGSQAFFLASRARRVVGIDISEVAIAQAAERARREGLARAGFQVMDAEALEFPDDTFDLICGSGILHHLDLERAYAELARTLKPAGTAIFSEPLGHNPLINAYRRRTPELRSVNCRPLRVDQVALAERYFGSVETTYFDLGVLAAVPFRRTPLFGPLLGALERLDQLLFASLPPLRRQAWMVLVTLAEPRKAALAGEGGP